MGNYYLIGEHLSHSFSAELHRRFGRYDYALREIAPDALGRFLKSGHFDGLNVTIPYKQTVIPYLDHLDESAAAIGAVNTVVRRNGELWGYNTDYGGMIASLCRTGIDLCGRKVLILGTGGTSKTAMAVCKGLGAAEYLRVSRMERDGAISYREARLLHNNAEVIIHCTPVGMDPDLDGMPLNPADFPKLTGVFDCVYNPLRTRLVLAAGPIPAGGGFYMLVKQAALACERFTGNPVSEQEVDAVCAALRRERENLILIGMPGSGKTTIARLIAQKTGKRFVDIDEEIVRQAKKTIPAIFAERGEAHFRALESAVVRAISHTGGSVIATGGGTVLRDENVIRLKQNGRLFYLDRPLDALEPSAERPLSDTAEKLRQLYEKRVPIYTGAADCVIPLRDDLQASVRTVIQRGDLL